MKSRRCLAAAAALLILSAAPARAPLTDAQSGVVRGTEATVYHPDPDGEDDTGRAIADRFVADTNWNGRRFVIFEDSVAANPDNRLILAHGVLPSQVTLRASLGGDLWVKAGSVNVVVRHEFTTLPGHHLGVQRIDFDTGSWNYADLLRLTGLGQRSTANAQTHMNPLETGYVYGTGDHDVIHANADQSQLHILEVTASAHPHNELVLGPGLLVRNAQIWNYDSDDYVLSFDFGPSIMIERMPRSRFGLTYGVQAIRFADGTTWTPQSIIAMLNKSALTGQFAHLSDDGDGHVLDTHGMRLLQSVAAFGGGDTFIFRRGYGQMDIAEEDLSDHPDNVLSFGPGIAPNDVRVSAASGGDDTSSVELRLNGTDDSVTLHRALNNRPGHSFGVQRVRFADGTEWTYADLLALMGDGGGAQETALGDPKANVFRFRYGQTIDGGGGGDSFLYDPGSGIVTLNEADRLPHPPNRLLMGKGIVSGSVTVLRDERDRIYLDLGPESGVLLAAEAAASPADDGVQVVQFADGTRWTKADLLRMAASNPLDRAHFEAKREQETEEHAKAVQEHVEAFEQRRLLAIYAQFLTDLHAGLDRIGIPSDEADGLLSRPSLRRNPTAGCSGTHAPPQWRSVETLLRWQQAVHRLADNLDLKYGTSDIDTAPDYMGLQRTLTPLNMMGAAINDLRRAFLPKTRAPVDIGTTVTGGVAAAPPQRWNGPVRIPTSGDPAFDQKIRLALDAFHQSHPVVLIDASSFPAPLSQANFAIMREGYDGTVGFCDQLPKCRTAPTGQQWPHEVTDLRYNALVAFVRTPGESDAALLPTIFAPQSFSDGTVVRTDGQGRVTRAACVGTYDPEECLASVLTPLEPHVMRFPTGGSCPESTGSRVTSADQSWYRWFDQEIATWSRYFRSS